MKGNPKQFYQYISSKTSKKDPIPDMVDVKGNISTTDSEKSSLLNDYFSSVFTKENVDEIPNFDKRTKSTDDIETVEVTEEEMLKLLQNLKADKSPGTDEIHPRLLK